MSATPSNQRGSILVCVVACLGIASALVLAMTQSALRAHKEVRTDRALRQTELLLEAGVQRIAQQLARDPEYTGETWILAPETIRGAESAQLELKVPSLDDGQWPRHAQVIARLPSGRGQVIQRSYRFPLNDLALSDQE